MYPIIKPHAIQPRFETIHAVWFYYNFGQSVCHIGLGVATNGTATTLRRAGVWAELVPVNTAAQAFVALQQMQARASRDGQLPISHVIISAPWLINGELDRLVGTHPNIHFTVLCHSNVAFISADRNGFEKIAHIADLSGMAHNLSLAGNCEAFADWAVAALRCRCAWLPNLYDVETFQPPRLHPWRDGVLKAGCYGAPRVQKNIISAAAAALELAEKLSVDVEFHVSVGRDENQRVLAPIRQLMAIHRRGRLVEDHWSNWAHFRRTIGRMDILLQPSWTESFNMVTADGVAEGVASAVLESVGWVPDNWIARLDDTGSLAATAMALLFNPHAPLEGQAHLRKYVLQGTRRWLDYLEAT